MPEAIRARGPIRVVTTVPATPILVTWDFIAAGAGDLVSMAGAVSVAEFAELAPRQNGNGKRAIYNSFQKTGKPAVPQLLNWNKSDIAAVGFVQRDSFCEGGRRALSPRGAALTKNRLKHPAQSWLHQNAHGLGVWVMRPFKG